MTIASVVATLALILFEASCSANVPMPATPRAEFPGGETSVSLSTADRASGGPCTVSVDGFVWYALGEGAVAPIDFQHVRCAAPGTLDGNVLPAIPSWAKATGPTEAIFVATSLQETYSLAGMQNIARVARGYGIPVTWLVGTLNYLRRNAVYYNAKHAEFGDDVELENKPALYAPAHRLLPWYSPAVSIEGAGHERNIARAMSSGNDAFWGITWNSHGTDSTSDEGAPWGTYCADVTAYKRPSPSGECSLLAFEWTARDLTRAYFARTNRSGYSAEAAFSTDPDDVVERAGFAPADGAAYVTALVDAYAAAGAHMPLVMVSQQETADQGAAALRDGVILDALYGEAKRVGMRVMTLRQAAVAARAFSAQPRAIAFPYIPGGNTSRRNGVAFFPATIDYHDDAAGMTFASGHTLPDRVFDYAKNPVATFDRPLVATRPGDAAYPSLKDVAVHDGRLAFTFDAPVATHFGVAVWTDPRELGALGGNVTPAGNAGFVAAFDLPQGPSVQNVPCPRCSSTTFPFSR
ncbi:MAG: hypothetical protein IAI50_12615 [Candidatus Eremiobacteraeota bacterium]|nr:hypothetical protein [Candidatus Eremiobacteraeota bacterium]